MKKKEERKFTTQKKRGIPTSRKNLLRYCNALAVVRSGGYERVETQKEKKGGKEPL